MRARTDRDHLLRDVHVVSQAGRVNRREPFPDEARGKVGHVQVDMAGGWRPPRPSDPPGHDVARGGPTPLLVWAPAGAPLSIVAETPPPPPRLRQAKPRPRPP